MFWLGDSQEGWLRNLRKFPYELYDGLKDNIPLCCVLTYGFAILLSLLTRKDSKVFEFIYRDESDFGRTDYWRCPLCKARKKVVKVRWDRMPFGERTFKRGIKEFLRDLFNKKENQ